MTEFSYDTEEMTRPADSDDYYPDPTKSRYRDARESYGAVINFGKGDLSSEVFINDNHKENWATGVKHDEDGNVIYEADDNGQGTCPWRGIEYRTPAFQGDPYISTPCGASPAGTEVVHDIYCHLLACRHLQAGVCYHNGEKDP